MLTYDYLVVTVQCPVSIIEFYEVFAQFFAPLPSDLYDGGVRVFSGLLQYEVSAIRKNWSRITTVFMHFK